MRCERYHKESENRKSKNRCGANRPVIISTSDQRDEITREGFNKRMTASGMTRPCVQSLLMDRARVDSTRFIRDGGRAAHRVIQYRWTTSVNGASNIRGAT